MWCWVGYVVIVLGKPIPATRETVILGLKAKIRPCQLVHVTELLCDLRYETYCELTYRNE